MIDAEAVASVPVASAFPKYAVGNKRRKNKKETEDEMRRQTLSARLYRQGSVPGCCLSVAIPAMSPHR